MIRRLVLVVALTASAAAGSAADARAGLYSVRACWDGEGVNHAWRHSATSALVQSFTQCPAGPSSGASNAGLTSRNTVGPSVAPGFTAAETYFDAPAGARIVRMWGDFNLLRQMGWQAGIADRSANQWKLCGTTCLTSSGWRPFDLPFSTGSVAIRAVCGQAACSRSQINGSISLRNVQVVLQEDSAPRVSIAGGSLVSGGWRRGVQQLWVNASDPIGIRTIAARTGAITLTRDDSTCDFTFAIPCPARQA